MAKKINKSEDIAVEKIKEMIKTEILHNYSTMTEFMRSDYGKTLKGFQPAYLSSTGTVSLPILNRLCEHFGLGVITRKVVVIRKVSYQLNDISTK